MKPVQSKKCLFKSLEGLTLEGELAYPETPPEGIAILCHPHPLYGGNMHNNIMDALWHALPQEHILTMRFNFRGVGNSEGKFEEGIGETGDLKGAIRFLSDMGHRALPVVLVGYSFGAYVIHLLDTLPLSVQGIVMISPPVSMIPFDPNRLKPCPALFITGDRDDFCSLTTLEALVAPKAMKEKSFTVVPGADHFWLGKEKELVENIRAWLKRQVAPLSS